MDSRTVKLFVDLGLPEEIVGEIDSHLIDIYRKEHQKKFRSVLYFLSNCIVIWCKTDYKYNKKILLTLCIN